MKYIAIKINNKSLMRFLSNRTKIEMRKSGSLNEWILNLFDVAEITTTFILI